jgi:hypothetical protein
MTKIASAFSFTGIILGLLIHAVPAEAQIARTWVSGASGAVDSNPCTRASPCATFQGAYAKTSAGGEIDVLDGGDFGPLTVNHAITIANDGGGVAGIMPPPAVQAAIYINAGSTDAVVLRGLTINGVNAGSFIVAGVVFTTGASLLLDHCTIEGFSAARESRSRP